VEHEKYYIVPWESEVTKKKVGENYFSVISPRFRAKDSRIMSILRTLFLFLHSLVILLIVGPDVLISTGSGLTLPPFLVARVFGIKTIFIESPSRVYNPSIAGKLLMGKTTLWLSSWPELAGNFTGVEYRGMIYQIAERPPEIERREMIFVTVGTSLPHDALIQALDELVGSGEIKDEVIAQRGAGQYNPKHIKSFRLKKSLDEFLQIAEIVIGNCGAGTIMENVTRGHRLIVIQNPDITGGHEWELASKMEKGDHLIWCKSLDSLKVSIDKARTMEFKPFRPKQLDLNDVLESLQ
jgi:UDP-N-acetylglucosamine transferase subunit ALG13